jgi:hypothetical protein
MRLVAENLAGERGGEPVFSGISFTLGAGESTGRHRPQRGGQVDAAAGDRRPAAGRRPEASPGKAAARHGRRPPAACHYLGHHNAMKTALTVARESRLLASPSTASREWAYRGARKVGLPASATSLSATCRPARSGAPRSPSCWSATARSGSSTSRRRVSTGLRRIDGSTSPRAGCRCRHPPAAHHQTLRRRRHRAGRTHLRPGRGGCEGTEGVWPPRRATGCCPSADPRPAPRVSAPEAGR